MEDLLLTPGPVQIPPRILQAMSQPAIHHRTPEFSKLFVAAREGLARLCEAEVAPILLASSGSGAMEAALLNSCEAGDTIIVLNGGSFGKRWVDIATRQKLKVVEITVPAGETVKSDVFIETLKAHPQAVAVCAQYTETSTTVLHPVNQLGIFVREYLPRALFIVDAVSTMGTVKISFKTDPIDIVVAGSQKAFMLPAGLSFVFANTRAWQKFEKRSSLPSLYFDLSLERKIQEKGTSAWTPATHIILGLNEALAMFNEEGFEQMYARHSELSRIAREKLAALGFTLLANGCPSPAVTGGYPPAGVDAEKLRAALYDRYKIRIAGGQESLSGKIIRIGHMGSITVKQLEGALDALYTTLKSNP